MFNSTKAKRDSHGVWWCAARTTIEVSMERVFGVTVHVMIVSFSYVAHPLTHFLPLHTVLPERLPPKHSFLFTRCAWFLYPILTYLLQMSFFLHALPQRNLIPSIAQPSLPFISSLALVLQTLLGPCAAYSPI